MVSLMLGQKVSIELKTIGGGWYFPFTAELREALEVQPDKDPTLTVMMDKNSKGQLYLAVFKK